MVEGAAVEDGGCAAAPSTIRFANGPPPRAGEDFRASASRLAGLAGALLGWRAAEFWAATPEELAGVLGALGGEASGVAKPDLARLQEMFPDG